VSALAAAALLLLALLLLVLALVPCLAHARCWRS
jgi:hypothetical protein